MYCYGHVCKDQMPMKRIDILIEQNDRLYDFLQSRIPFCCCNCRKNAVSTAPPSVWGKSTDGQTAYTEEELMTIDMGKAEMKVCRSTIYNLIKNGKLTKLDKDGKARLIKAEVMAAKIWYSKAKGKL